MPHQQLLQMSSLGTLICKLYLYLSHILLQLANAFEELPQRRSHFIVLNTCMHCVAGSALIGGTVRLYDTQNQSVLFVGRRHF
uniref:Putative secreted protein n=1 Tax=Anopheles darlingi TaxID=43151 RepID=A0A2M4D661_ANODA